VFTTNPHFPLYLIGNLNFLSDFFLQTFLVLRQQDMDAENKDYAFKNEISLSIGDESVTDSVSSTPSTVTPQGHPTPSPRQNLAEDTKPLTQKNGNMSKPDGIDNKAFDGNEKASGKPLTSFGNGHSNGLNDSGANGANKNGQLNEKKLAGETLSTSLLNHRN
jgi:hypothetical protein